MAGRKPKATLDFIQIDTNEKITLKRLKRNYGKEGRLFWFDLLRLLGRSDWYYLDLKDKYVFEDYMLDEFDISTETGENILNHLADWGNICKNTWKTHRVVWCQALINRHKELFRKRGVIPKNPYLDFISAEEIQECKCKNEKNSISAEEKGISAGEMQQIKLNKIKLNNTITSNIEEVEEKFDWGSKDVFLSVDFLAEKYLNHNELVIAVIKNKENKFEDFEHLKSRMPLFIERLKEDGILTTTPCEFAPHFRRWNKKNITESVKKIYNNNPYSKVRRA